MRSRPGGAWSRAGVVDASVGVGGAISAGVIRPSDEVTGGRSTQGARSGRGSGVHPGTRGKGPSTSATGDGLGGGGDGTIVVAMAAITERGSIGGGGTPGQRRSGAATGCGDRSGGIVGGSVGGARHVGGWGVGGKTGRGANGIGGGRFRPRRCRAGAGIVSGGGMRSGRSDAGATTGRMVRGGQSVMAG